MFIDGISVSKKLGLCIQCKLSDNGRLVSCFC